VVFLEQDRPESLKPVPHDVTGATLYNEIDNRRAAATMVLVMSCIISVAVERAKLKIEQVARK